MSSELTPARTTRIVLAGAHAVVREGLKVLIGVTADLKVVGETAEGRAVVDLVTQHDPDIVIVDTSLPWLNGLELAVQIRTARPGQKVLLLSTHEDLSLVRRFFEAGVSGYALKQATVTELIHAIRIVAEGGTYIDPSLVGVMVQPSMPVQDAELSAREAEVVRQVAQGYSNKEIAASLEISIKTVETYKARALEKLRLRSRVDLVRYAVRRGWLDVA